MYTMVNTLIKGLKKDYWRKQLSKVKPLPKFTDYQLSHFAQEIQKGIALIRSGRPRMELLKSKRRRKQLFPNEVKKFTAPPTLLRTSKYNDVYLPWQTPHSNSHRRFKK